MTKYQQRARRRVTYHSNTISGNKAGSEEVWKKLTPAGQSAVQHKASACKDCPCLHDYDLKPCRNWPDDPGQTRVRVKCVGVENGTVFTKPKQVSNHTECSMYQQHKTKQRERRKKDVA
jgi:hypothetical protein